MARKSTTFVVVSWALVALCAGFIFFMSSNTDTGLNDGLGLFSRIFQDLKALQAQLLGPEVDVVSSIAHFCEYTVLGALLANALRCHMPLRRACSCRGACAIRWTGSWTPPALLSGRGWPISSLGGKGAKAKSSRGRGRLRRGNESRGMVR